MSSVVDLGPARLAWAKPGDESAYLSVWQHLVDAAGVAERLWESFLAPSIKESLSAVEGLSVEELRRLAVFLAGVHDCGKISRSFQLKIPPGVNREMILGSLEDSGLSLELGTEEVGAYFPHGLASSMILQTWLVSHGVWGPIAASLAMVVESHHGIPANKHDYDKAVAILEQYPREWREAQESVLNEMADRCGVHSVLPMVERELTIPTIQLLTGLVIASDWCASNEKAFPYIFTEDQGERVTNGLDAIGLAGIWHASETMTEDVAAYFAAAFGWPAGWEPRVIQREAFLAAGMSTGASLSIIEATTGGGKTEAALAAAHVLASKHGCHGVVFAAPTMATANGLFERVIMWAQNVVAPGDVTAAYLAHSKNELVEGFQKLKFKGVAPDSNETGSVSALQWFASPKKGLLSNFAIATVDQVLMMALQSRYNMLRHLGLAGKVVIIDEVHAYDAFTSAYLETALKWLAWYDVPVILLSATLPVAKKEQLVRAYRSYLDEDAWEASSVGYPLLTVSDQVGVREIPMEIGPLEIRAEVQVIDDSEPGLVQLMQRLINNGGCALVVCNTVRRAQEAYQALSRVFPEEVELHHAAFIASERAAKEGMLLKQLGPAAQRGLERPERRIFVATQVVEQSLDIDVDVLISDIAPIDSVVQRIGRLHRHKRSMNERPEDLRSPQVYIRGAKRWDGVPEFDSGVAAIYDPLVLLASSAVVLGEWAQNGFSRPDDLASVVRETYAQLELENPPFPSWSEAWIAAKNESESEKANKLRRSETFRYPEPESSNFHAMFERYQKEKGTALAKEEAAIAQVRDADPSIEVIPIEIGDYGYRPWGSECEFLLADEAPDFRLTRTLASGTVRLPTRMSKHQSVFDKVIEQLESETPVGWVSSFLLKGQVALCLDANGLGEIAGFKVRYSAELGLEVT